MKSNSTSDSKQPYFQFPLCLLSSAMEFKEILNRIVSYGLVEAGRKSFKTKFPNGRGFKTWMKSQRSTPNDFDIPKQDHKVALWGASVTNVSLGSASKVLKEWKESYKWADEIRGEFGNDKTVRIPTDYVWCVIEKGSLSEREFRILCALSTEVGGHSCYKVSAETIATRASGCKAASFYDEICNWENDHFFERLSTRQVRTTLETLHLLKFFSRITFGRRHTYYSFKLTGEQLANRIIEIKSSKQKRRNSFTASSKEVNQQVQLNRASA